MLPRVRGLLPSRRPSSTALAALRTPLARPLQLPRRLLSTAAAEAGQAEAARKVARWSARLAHDNTFLSYHRNAIIATVAGCALIQYRKGEGRPPLAGAGLLVMGGLYIWVGSGLYIWQVVKLRQPLRLRGAHIFWSIFNATWPCALWSVSLACLLDETPNWLIEGLRYSEGYLPGTLRSSLFIDPPALYPVSRLLHAVMRQEELRLQTVCRHAHRAEIAGQASGRVRRRESTAGGWGSSALGASDLLTDADVAAIISKRLERLAYLQAKISMLTRSDQSVPTALAAPLLDTLQTEVAMLEKVLEVDTSQGDMPIVVWWSLVAFSSEHARLKTELDAVQKLLRRLEAVKFSSVAYTARALSNDTRIRDPREDDQG